MLLFCLLHILIIFCDKVEFVGKKSVFRVKWIYILYMKTDKLYCIFKNNKMVNMEHILIKIDKTDLFENFKYRILLSLHMQHIGHIEILGGGGAA